MSPTPPALTLARAHWHDVLAHVQAQLPNEACGLLAGLAGAVRRVYVTANVLASPTEFLADPQQQVRAMLDMEAAGWELIGIFHSHPAGPPVPSATDVARANYPDAVQLIVAPGQRGEWQGRAFRIEAGRVEPVSLVVLPE